MKLLIVDDEKSVREMTRFSINTSQIGVTEVLEAGNGQEALDLLRSHRPEITLLDMNMPGMSGAELMRRIEEEQLPTQLVVISGYDDFEYVRQALLHHAANYILKPIQARELNDTLARIAEHLNSPDVEPRPLPSFMDKPDQHVLNAYADYAASMPNQTIISVQILVNDAKELLQRFAQDAELMFLEIVTHLTTVLDGKGRVAKSLNGTQQIYVFLPINRHDESRPELVYFCERAAAWLQRHRFCCTFAIADQTAVPHGCMRALWNGNLRCVPYLWESEIRPVPIGMELDSLGMRQGILCAMRMRNGPALVRAAEAILSSLEQEAYISLQYLTSIAEELCSASRRSSAISDVKLPENLFAALDVQTILQRMLGWIETLSGSIRQSERMDELTARAVEYILNHYRETITLDILAHVLYSSREHICKQFKRSMGVNLFAYLRNTRLERAFLLVQRTALPIADIAQEVGFTDSSYFIKVFKKRYGCAPMVLRKSDE